jgi:hypothetical protein
MPIDGFDESIYKIHALIDLEGEHCHLKHSTEDPAENHPAVDYLCQGFGDKIETNDGSIIEVPDSIIRIPICAECVEALLGDEWILLYCVNCNSSQWICRKYAKYPYPPWLHVKWMDECPICFGESQ